MSMAGFCAPCATVAPTHGNHRVCTRRAAVAALALLMLPRVSKALAVDAFGIGDAVGSEEFEGLRGRVKGDVSLAEFVRRLESGAVTRVWFFGVMNEFAAFQGADGVVFHIGEGYPVESARSPQSPLQVMARVRDHKVPYTVAPVSGRYLKR